MNMDSRADESGCLIMGVEHQKRDLYMGEEFLVSTGYSGYVFVGWAAGQFENGRGEKTPYANMFAINEQI